MKTSGGRPTLNQRQPSSDKNDCYDMEREDTTKKLLTTHAGEEKKGRPKKIWLDG